MRLRLSTWQGAQVPPQHGDAAPQHGTVAPRRRGTALAKRRGWTALATGVLAAAAVAVPVSLATTGSVANAAATSGGVKIAYFDQWSIYQNAFYLKNLDTEGIAGKLNYLIYDFENIDPTNLTCFETTKATDPDPAGENDPNAGDGAGDAFADYQKTFDATTSVSGVADTYNQPIVGNFNQLKELKAKYPNLHILLSIGGWTYSKYFSDVAKTAASRQKFVSSCVDMFIKGNLPSQGGYGGTGTAAGIFDGFDIDWEYPGSSGGHLGNHVDPTNDPADFTALLAEFRSELNAYGSANGRQMYLTAALPAGQDKIPYIQTNQIGQYLDYGDIMTYDMHGAWETTTNEQDPLYASPSDPSSVAPGTEKYSIDAAMKAWTQGDSAYNIPGGFPASKAVVGFPFYYRGWTGVPAGSNHGLYQSSTGGSPAMTLSGSVPGIAMYKEISSTLTNPADTYYDSVTQSSYWYDGTNFYSGDSPQSIQAKANYIHCNGYAGAMMFSLYDLDPAATLFNDVVTDINGSAPGCTPVSQPPTTAPPTTAPPTTTPPSTTPPTTTPPTTPPGGCTAPAWNSTTAYSGGAVVSENGHKYTANWWSQGADPATHSGPYQEWTDNGPCGTAPPTTAPPTTAPPTTAPPTTAPPTTAPPSSGVAAWAPNTAYHVGDLVTYGGHTYKCLQAHTSLVGWEPPNVPALWQLVS